MELRVQLSEPFGEDSSKAHAKIILLLRTFMLKSHDTVQMKMLNPTRSVVIGFGKIMLPRTYISGA